ncbi:sigma-54-dependent transcriptional regulator [Candidatus Tisiphia endosymbiont of Nemotelus uliginosus]|uniref:sigma-54-dependent transcriptional regulator n=1 Tax=Candidatus Tisiphia endosymbiont of Nemotelus uliginosus TaxID=3077926 RepID=UPI0035C8CFEF
MMSIDVLVVDDEADIRDLVSDILKEEGFTTKTAANSMQALKILHEKTPSAIILDIWLQGSELDGLGVLEIVKKRYPLMPVIVISGHGTIETAVNAIKMGAYDYLEKPFSHDKLVILLKRACEATKLKRENLDLKSKVINKTELIGNSHITAKLKSDIEKAALATSRVFIQGKIGSGKELAARLIHKKSKRASGPFVIFSPVCMDPDRIHQELFKGIDNQDIRRPSILEVANSGTLYIDEISGLPVSVQVNLLKFLQDQMFHKPGGKPIKLDIRVIAATSKTIQEEISKGEVLEDLYHRLNVISLKVPSLYERKDDMSVLVKYFVKQLSKFSGLKTREFSDETIAAFQVYSWPGNIRQLRNVIEWTLIMNSLSSNNNQVIKPTMIPPEILVNGSSPAKQEDNVDIMIMPLREAREVFEKQYLAAQMHRFNNNISKTSAFVGMERSALHRKLKLLNLHIPSNKFNDEDFYDNYE